MPRRPANTKVSAKEGCSKLTSLAGMLRLLRVRLGKNVFRLKMRRPKRAAGLGIVCKTAAMWTCGWRVAAGAHVHSTQGDWLSRPCNSPLKMGAGR
jgi:hypothetical protein